MRNILLAATTVLLLASPAAAQSQASPKLDKSFASGKTLPLKETTSRNPCAAYGPGFIKLADGTCVHVGGSLSVQGGAGR